MAAMEKLYPPTINSSIPAFCDDGSGTVVITVPFSMNRAVSANQINSFKLKIKSAQSNTYITTLTSEDTVSEIINEKQVQFQFNINQHNNGTGVKIHIGQYLKFQLAYESTDGITGYFSTVAVGKYTARPSVIIKEYELYPNRVLNYNKQYHGEYILNSLDKTERPYAYKFTLFNQFMQVEETSDWKLHNSSLDSSSLDSTIDTYTFARGIDEIQTYYIQYSVKTINDLIIDSPIYSCAAMTIADTRISDIILDADNIFDEGYIHLQFSKPEGATWSSAASPISILIERSDSISNFTNWITIQKVYFASKAAIADWQFEDRTIEQGVYYQYRFGLYDAYGNQSTQSRSNIIEADFEDMFLYDGNRQLKVRFNPKMSSFKETIQESKIDTIGSKYPYVFRNKTVRYKEFPIGGLISYLSDSNEAFLSEEDYGIQSSVPEYQFEMTEYKKITYVEAKNMKLSGNYSGVLFYDTGDIVKHDLKNETLREPGSMDYNYYHRKNVTTVYSSRNATPVESTDISNRFATTKPVGYNIMAERQFKMKVLEWLNDGNIKLFRSPTEGNFLIKLMNVSLSPEDRLGRMLHSFSAQAYEIDELNYDNLLKYGFLSKEVGETVVFSLKRDILKNKTGNYFKINSLPIWDSIVIDLSQASNQNDIGIYFRLGNDITTKFLVPFGTSMSIEMQVNDTHVPIPNLYFYREDNDENIVNLFTGCQIHYWVRNSMILSGSVEDQDGTVIAIYRDNRSFNIYGLIPSYIEGLDVPTDYYRYDLDSPTIDGNTVHYPLRPIAVQFHRRVRQEGYSYSDETLYYNGEVIPSSNYDKTVVYVTEDKGYIVRPNGKINSIGKINEITNNIVINDEIEVSTPPTGISLLDYHSIDLSNAPEYYCTIISQEKIIEHES